MSYIKHTWVDNETITASKLNNIEDGIDEVNEKIASGNIYDAVVSIYHDNISVHNYEITIESGSYAELKAKLMVNDPPVILAKVWDNLTGFKGATTMTSLYMFPSQEDPNSNIIFAVKAPSTNTAVHTQWFGVGVEWNSSDEVAPW